MNPAVRPALAAAMSRDAGVLREHEDMERLQQTLGQAPPASGALDLATVEATSLHAVSVLVAAAALARAESRGCHRWRDGRRPSSPPHRPAIPWCAWRRATVVRVAAAQPRVT